MLEMEAKKMDERPQPMTPPLQALTKLTIPPTPKTKSRPTSSSSASSLSISSSSPASANGMFLSPPVTPISSTTKSRNDIFNEDSAFSPLSSTTSCNPPKKERLKGLGLPSNQTEEVDVWDREARKRRSGAWTWGSSIRSRSSTPGNDDSSASGLRVDYSNVLGHGLTSVVYTGTISSGEVVAAKVPVNDDSERTLEREAIILSYLHSLPHSNRYIIPFFGKFEFDETFALCLKVCPQTMQEYITSKAGATNQPVVGEELWKSWLTHLLSAIDFLHEAGILHNDIKPHNILLTPSLHPLLTDFAVSTSVSLPHSPSTLPPPDMHVGTTVFTAPELLSAEDVPTSPEADMYSLGITMFVAAMGSEPFAWTKSGTQKIMLKKRGNVFAGAEIRMPLDLVEIVRGLCEVDAGRRWDSSKARRALHQLS
jgi:Protein kinase domain